MSRGTIHVDMDAFFAAIEQLDFPELRGKPVVVGARPDSRGVVATASYEARRFGIRSAMPSREAFRRCPHAVFRPGRGSRYSELSRQIMAILREEGERVESVSCDEAYVDPGEREPLLVARTVKRRIAAETGLTASVGLAPNKYLAKLASDLDKPDGFTVIGPGDVTSVLAPLAVRSLPGIGPSTAAELAILGIHTVAQLRAFDRGLLRLQFGRRAGELLDLAYGRDNRPVQPHHETKSISRETTFATDVADWAVLSTQLGEFAAELGGRLAEAGLRARTVTIKVRFADFHTISRSHTGPGTVSRAGEIERAAETLLRSVAREDRVRLIGLGVSGLTDRPKPVQLRFVFADANNGGHAPARGE